MTSAPPLPDRQISQAQHAIDGMQSFLAFFVNAMGAALCIALITSAILYLLRPLTGRLIQSQTIKAWFQQGAAWKIEVPEWLLDAARFNEVPQVDQLAAMLVADAEQASAMALHDLKTRPGQLRDELFMHALQNEVKASIARPSSAFGLFLIATSGTQPDVRGAIAFFDLMARVHPELASRIAAFDDPEEDKRMAEFHAVHGMAAPTRSNATAAALQAAEAALQSAAENFLDRLQLSLVSRSLWPARVLAILTGTGLAAAAAYALQLNGPTGLICLCVGAAGGVLSLFISDALGLISQRLIR